MKRHPHTRLITLLLLTAVAHAGGCASKPAARQTGFLSDYAQLKKETDARMAYRSPELAHYNAFIIEPVQVRVPADKLSPEDSAEAARYFRDALVRVVRGEGLTVTDKSGQGVAKLRVALTDIAKSTWWKKIHPASRVAGAGTGGAAMEAEVIDSISGKQLAANVQSGSGNQFNLTAFSTLADVKSAIDGWAKHAAHNLHELRTARP